MGYFESVHVNRYPAGVLLGEPIVRQETPDGSDTFRGAKEWIGLNPIMHMILPGEGRIITFFSRQEF